MARRKFGTLYQRTTKDSSGKWEDTKNASGLQGHKVSDIIHCDRLMMERGMTTIGHGAQANVSEKGMAYFRG